MGEGVWPTDLKSTRDPSMLDGVDGLLNHGSESSGRAGVEDQSPNEAASFRMRDVLDREAIDKIEALHSAVVRAEAEQRFGLLRGKRSRQLVEAEAAEQGFLEEQGFATYNDFRLRIRRSTISEEPQEAGESSTYVWDDDYDERGFFPDGEGEPNDPDDHGDTDPETHADEGTGDHLSPEEGSEDMAPLPEPAAMQAAPPPPMAPPPPIPATRPDDGAASNLDLRRLTEPLFATLQAETDKYVAARMETAERQAADIVNRASREAAEIIGRAARMHEAVKSLVEDVTRQSETFLGITEDLPARIAQIRDGVSTDLRNLRDLADSGPGEAAGGKPSSFSEPSSVWNAPAKVAPPPPVPAAAPPE
jgi:hypothetical protein